MTERLTDDQPSLIVAMVGEVFPDDDDLPDGPVAVLRGDLNAVRAAGALLGQKVPLQPVAEIEELRGALRRIREIALQSEAARASMGEIVARVDIALGEETPLPTWMVRPAARKTITIYAAPTRDEITAWANTALRNSEINFIDEALFSDFADGLTALEARP